MPRFGEYQRGFIGFAAHLNDARMAGDRCDEWIIAVRSQCRGEALHIGYLKTLAANADDLVLQPGFADGIDLRRRVRPGKVNAAYQRAASSVARLDVQCHRDPYPHAL